MNISERFLKYVSFPTMSASNSDTFPSTAKQLELAKYLVNELKQIGIENAHMDENGYVYARVETNVDCKETIGLIAHMDTALEAADDPIKPRTVHYGGGDILLNEEKGIVLSPNEYPNLNGFIGHDLIVTDGTTLLGGDDKAGIAEIVSAVEYVLKNDLPRPNIAICFTPDEEIGKGADKFDVEKFNADYAYTVDGSILGQIEYQNFNAAKAEIEINGRVIHTGCAKGKMINAASIACEIESMMPQDKKPETTEGYEGFLHLGKISGGVEHAEMRYSIREHDGVKYEQMKNFIQEICQKLNGKYGENTVTCKITESYRNMEEIIEKNMYIIDRAKAAVAENGIEPTIAPIRGGTDGARLSFMGLPCPNICTGAENYHSRFEYISVQVMEKIKYILVSLITDVVYKPEENK